MSAIKYRNCPLQCEHLVQTVEDELGNFTTSDDGITGSIDDSKGNYLTMNPDGTMNYNPPDSDKKPTFKQVFTIDYENRLLVFITDYRLKFKVPYHG